VQDPAFAFVEPQQVPLSFILSLAALFYMFTESERNWPFKMPFLYEVYKRHLGCFR